MRLDYGFRNVVRAIAILVMLAPSVGTSCTAFGALALAPSPAVPTDRIARASFPIVARLAGRYGLAGAHGQAWPECFSRETFHLCGKIKDGEVQLRMYQAMTPHFTPWADSLRRELLDSLRLEVGVSAVRECQWRLERDDARSGCPPLAAEPGHSTPTGT